MSSAELVRVEPLLPMEPDVARAAMQKYRELTEAMLVADDWQTIPGGRFVKRSGFQKIASGYGISTQIMEEDVERDDAGQPVRASALVRATHPTGRFAEGSGRCSVDESRFKSASGRAKVEHDLPATAVTRATNRAISNLVGFGQVSAEEMDGVAPDGATPAQPLPFGNEVDDEGELRVEALVRELYPAVDGHVFVEFFKRQLGTQHIPEASARLLAAIKWALGDERVRAPIDAEVAP